MNIEDDVERVRVWTPRESALANECRRLRRQLEAAMAFVPKDWEWPEEEAHG